MFYTLQQNSNQVVEIIKAIGSTWPILLVLFLITIFIIYNKRIAKYLSGYNKISGKTSIAEFTLEKPLEKPQIEFTGKEVTTIELETTQTEVQDKINQDQPKEEEISFYNVFLLIQESKKDEADKMFLEVQKKETDIIVKEKNDLFYLYAQFMYGGIDTIPKLESKIEKLSDGELKALAFEYLGDCFYKGKNFDKAESAFRNALAIQNQESNRSNLVRSIADCMFDQNKKQSAIDYLFEVVKDFKDRENIAAIYKKIASFFEKNGDWIQKCLALELAVEQQPNDTSLLFDIAYAYSDTDKNSGSKIVPLSLLHYTDLLEFNPKNKTALNNLGVAYGDLQLKGKAINYFQKSAALEETLAVANVAYRYISQGFYEKAEEILNEAKIKDTVHENVWSALKHVNDEKSKETEKENKIVENTKEVQFYLKEFSKLHFDKNTSDLHLNTNWKINGQVISYKQLPNPGFHELSWSDNTNKYNISVNVKGKKTCITEGDYTPKVGGLIKKVIGFIMEVDNNIKVLLIDKSDYRTFFFETTT